jgi:hypothetical protein
MGLILLSVAGCGMVQSEEAYKFYPGPVQPDSQLATLVLDPAVPEIHINGFRVNSDDYGSIELLPDIYRLSWGSSYLVSVMVDSSGQGEAHIDTTAQLQAGCTYFVKFDRTTGHGYKIYLWIEEEQSGAVIAGERKP